MSKDDGDPHQEKVDHSNDDQEDILWFENYEKSAKSGEQPENLKNEDILNYIKEIEQNCRLELSSGDEDYAGTKGSSNCSVRFSGVRGSNPKRIKSRVLSRKKNQVPPGRKIEHSSDHNVTDAARGYSSRNVRLRENLAKPGYSKENVDNPAGQSTGLCPGDPRSSIKRSSYNLRQFAPTSPRTNSYNLYVRKDRATCLPTSKTTSLEIIMDRSRSSRSPDREMDNPRTADKKSARLRAFKSLHRKKTDDQTYASMISNITFECPNERETTVRNVPRSGEDRTRINRTSRFRDQGDVSGFVDQRRLNKFYRDACLVESLRQDSRSNERHADGRCAYGYRCPVRRLAQNPATWGPSSRFNRLTMPRLVETSLRQRALRREMNGEARPPLETSSTGGESIDRGGCRWESWRKSNTDPRRREPNVSEQQGCCHRPEFPRETGKLRKVPCAREGKLSPGCCYEDERGEETADYSYSPESANRRDFRVRQRDTLDDTLFRAMQSRCEKPLDFSSSTGERTRRSETMMYGEDTSMFESGAHFDYDRAANDYDYRTRLGHRPRADDSRYQACYPCENLQCTESSCDIDSNLRWMRNEPQKLLRRPIIRRYRPGEESCIAMLRAHGRKLVPRDSRRRLRRDVAESTCQCTEPMHAPPAACLVGSCSCIGDKRNNDDDDDDDDDLSSRDVSTGEIYSHCCCCSSTSSDNKNPRKNPGEKFSFEKPERDTSRKPSKPSTCCGATGTNPQRYSNPTSKEPNSSRFIGKQWMTLNPTGVRVGRPKGSRDRTNLEKILIYPPHGETGPPLTLYKGSSNINCRVKGNAETGFRYNVTYVQKFVSPTWMPGTLREAETSEEYECSADHG